MELRLTSLHGLARRITSSNTGPSGWRWPRSLRFSMWWRGKARGQRTVAKVFSAYPSVASEREAPMRAGEQCAEADGATVIGVFVVARRSLARCSTDFGRAAAGSGWWSLPRRCKNTPEARTGLLWVSRLVRARRVPAQPGTPAINGALGSRVAGQSTPSRRWVSSQQ